MPEIHRPVGMFRNWSSAARAARQGQSLQEFLRSELIALAERPDNRSLMASIRARKHQARSALSAERIL